MELCFSTALLRKVCEREKIALDHFDPIVVSELKARIADMRAAETVTDLLAGKPTAFTKDGHELFSLSLPESKSIIFVPNHRKSPTFEGGRVDWSRVYRVKITEIGGIQ